MSVLTLSDVVNVSAKGNPLKVCTRGGGISYPGGVCVCVCTNDTCVTGYGSVGVFLPWG